ncbi:protein AMBP-like isoform X2 [Parambassis ranga]|uniref:Protein AMBP-like isoform X1 n=1 Tax=Parambassis ranga TaxID=210632 RepID=A0A6P7JAD7_9TELE|nr:protein AMBP-like isoform X1 [Parambassis ranga]XP_028273091.1 protein AMBP-like isoform X2 [Parambassis ranga]
MQRVLGLVSLLALARSAWTLQVVSVQPETLIQTQADFDLDKFTGKWYEVAVVSNCPHYMQRKRRNPMIPVIVFKHMTSKHNLTMTTTTLRNELCKETTTVLSLTNIPGRFFHHVAWIGADVDSFVVHTNYDEYAMMNVVSTEQPSGNKTTTVKLYSRTVDVRPALLDDFKSLAQQDGVSTDVIMNQYKGECPQGEQVAESIARPQSKRSVDTDRIPAQHE